MAFVLGCAAQAADSLARYSFTERHMGVDVKILCYADSEALAEQASTAAFARIDALNACLSDYDAESEVRRLSTTGGMGQSVVVSDDLWRVLQFSRDVYDASEGAFDPTVGPYVLAWRQSRYFGGLPRAEKLARMKKSVGFEKVRMKDQAVELLSRSMRLDLGGCAKGYVIDQALKTMKQIGVKRVLIDAGGDLAIGDPPPGAEGWKVDVEDGARRLVVANCGVATSGDVYQFLEVNGVRYSHILDPRTGLGVTHQTQVTIIAPDGMTADAWASALSVLGQGAASEKLAKAKGLEVFWVSRK